MNDVKLPSSEYAQLPIPKTQYESFKVSVPKGVISQLTADDFLTPEVKATDTLVTIGKSLRSQASKIESNLYLYDPKGPQGLTGEMQRNLSLAVASYDRAYVNIAEYKEESKKIYQSGSPRKMVENEYKQAVVDLEMAIKPIRDARIGYAQLAQVNSTSTPIPAVTLALPQDTTSATPDPLNKWKDFKQKSEILPSL
jgi:hypothetical protein